MKPRACLVNMSRGRLVDSTAVIEALKSRHLGGLALDVYEEEEGSFIEDHSGAVLQDDELPRLLCSMPLTERHSGQTLYACFMGRAKERKEGEISEFIRARIVLFTP